MFSATAPPAFLHSTATVATTTAAAAAATPPLRAVTVPLVSAFPVPPAAGPVSVIAAVFGRRSVRRMTISLFFSETMFDSTEVEEARLEDSAQGGEGMGGCH